MNNHLEVATDVTMILHHLMIDMNERYGASSSETFAVVRAILVGISEVSNIPNDEETYRQTIELADSVPV